MKKTIVALLGVQILLAAAAQSEETMSFGFGAGAMYNGIGANVASKSGNELKYVAVGCPGIAYSDTDGWETPCGIGIGWVRADLLSPGTAHGLGVHIGPVGLERERGAEWERHHKLEPVYGIGASYVFFPKRIDGKGINYGVTPAGSSRGYLSLQIGYQN